MTYNAATGDYQNDYMEEFFSGFYCNIPYKIKIDRYRELIKLFNTEYGHTFENRFKNSDVITVSISYDDHVSWDNLVRYRTYTIFVWPNSNSDDDMYDCFQFNSDDTERNKKDYDQFRMELKNCVIEVDKELATKVRENLITQVSENMKHINKIGKLIYES